MKRRQNWLDYQVQCRAGSSLARYRRYKTAPRHGGKTEKRAQYTEPGLADAGNSYAGHSHTSRTNLPQVRVLGVRERIATSGSSGFVVIQVLGQRRLRGQRGAPAYSKPSAKTVSRQGEQATEKGVKQRTTRLVGDAAREAALALARRRLRYTKTAMTTNSPPPPPAAIATIVMTGLPCLEPTSGGGRARGTVAVDTSASCAATAIMEQRRAMTGNSHSSVPSKQQHKVAITCWIPDGTYHAQRSYVRQKR